jgi:sphingomyelin phosphodiesterase
MAEKINEIAPDVLFWTGDVPPHDQWNYSQPYEERYQAWLFTFMQEHLNQWSTYPLEGNHDFGFVINS